MNEKASVTKELNARHKKVPIHRFRSSPPLPNSLVFLDQMKSFNNSEIRGGSAVEICRDN